jgi:putative heme-binding domain-containing protein
LLTAILAPDAAAENVFRLYRVVKKDGGIIEGFKRGEDARELTLLAMGGTAIPVPVAEIREAGYLDGRSMMPDLTAGMSPEMVGSIVAYLRTVK